MRRIRKIWILCAVLLFWSAASQAVSAADAARLTLHYRCGETNFSFYQVAKVLETGDCQLTEEFARHEQEITDLSRLGEELTAQEWTELASTLRVVAASDAAITQMYAGRTDADGTLVLEAIEEGLYLLVGESHEGETYRYTPNPTLFWVSQGKTDGDWQSIELYAKASEEEITEDVVSCQVRKIWKNETNKGERPQSIQAALWMDGELYGESVTLDASNQWTYIWTDLPAGHTWTVDEVSVPKGYQKQITQDGSDYIITNIYQTPETPDTPTSGKLPQTGQLWWPVPILMMLGVILCTVGWVRRRTSDN